MIEIQTNGRTLKSISLQLDCLDSLSLLPKEKTEIIFVGDRPTYLNEIDVYQNLMLVFYRLPHGIYTDPVTLPPEHEIVFL